MSWRSWNVLPAALASLLVATSAHAQDGYRPPPHLTPQEAAAQWLAGRYRMPVTCIRPDGTRVQVEEAVVLRPAPADGRQSIKATFFGIEGQGFERCYNVVERDIPDRRGVLYLHLRAHTRLDTGMSEFRRMMADGSLTLHVHRGLLRIRPIGGQDDEVKTLRFDSADEHSFTVSVVTPGSDADKLLSGYAPDRAGERQRKRLSLRLTGPDDLALVTHMIEDEGRWR